MIKPGKIVIKDKVYFEYYELSVPSRWDYLRRENLYIEKFKEYEASKQLIEVDNFSCKGFGNIEFIDINNETIPIKDNTPCKAEITGDKAIIIELL